MEKPRRHLRHAAGNAGDNEMKICKTKNCNTEIPNNRQYCNACNKSKKIDLQKLWRKNNPEYHKKYQRIWRKELKKQENEIKRKKMQRLAA